MSVFFLNKFENDVYLFPKLFGLVWRFSNFSLPAKKITKLELLFKVCEEYFDNFDISYNAHFDNLALKNKKKDFIIIQKAQV